MNRTTFALSAIPLLLVACGNRDKPQEFAPAPSASARFAAVTHSPPKLTSIETAASTWNGTRIRVTCPTCHSMREALPLPRDPKELKDFHRGMTFQHGTVSCASCHAKGQPPMLRLADGREIPTSDAILLCAQCHGPQYRDYQHGAHGGNRGYWDLSRGGQDRNHCVDCHDPHAPKYPKSTPVLPPRDRNLVPHTEGSHG